jgi:hypothetical protein
MPTSNNVSAAQGNDKTKSNNVSAAPDIVTITNPVGPQSLGDLNGGSYTFTDTAGVALSSYSYNSANDIHTFNVNTIGVANETYSLISGANFTSPKWQKLLTYSDGSPVLAGDAFSIDVVFDNVSTGTARQYLVAVAVIQSPTSTVIGTLRPSGMYCLTTSVGTPGVGVVADNLGAVATIASMTLGCGSTTFGGKPTMPKAGGTCAVVSATSASVNTRGDGNTWSVATTQQLSLGIFLSTNGTVTTTAGAFAMRIKYIATKLG